MSPEFPAWHPPDWRWRRNTSECLPTMLMCTNHPASPGELREVLPTETCRNFKTQCWWPSRLRQANAAKGPPSPPPMPKRRKGVRRIPLSQGLFATVDAADSKKVSQYKWCAIRHGCKVYASAKVNGKTVLMHRFLLRPRKGYFVDHIDGNGLNNCRRNLRVCTPAQNQANRRPFGRKSRFVGVYPCGKKWEAEITWRGERYYLGRYDDEVEAAKARDRKAYELHGEHAYLNFPEDYRR